jgi:hypothetical protein
MSKQKKLHVKGMNECREWSVSLQVAVETEEISRHSSSAPLVIALRGRTTMGSTEFNGYQGQEWQRRHALGSHPIYSLTEFFFMLLSTSRSGGTPLKIGIVVIINCVCSWAKWFKTGWRHVCCESTPLFRRTNLNELLIWELLLLLYPSVLN